MLPSITTRIPFPALRIALVTLLASTACGFFVSTSVPPVSSPASAVPPTRPIRRNTSSSRAHHHHHHHHHHHSSAATTAGSALRAMTANEIFASDGWKPICEDLDRLPVFTVASAETGRPVIYDVQHQGRTHQVPFFYTDVEAAQLELVRVNAQKSTATMEDIDLMAFPLGQAFMLNAADQAVLVPSKTEVLQAGAPAGTHPLGQPVPLFACTEIAEESPSGQAILPLFLKLEDAADALHEAVEADGGSVDEFDIVPFTLNRAVELLAENPESTAFHFIPPSCSMQYIEDFLQSSD